MVIYKVGMKTLQNRHSLSNYSKIWDIYLLLFQKISSSFITSFRYILADDSGQKLYNWIQTTSMFYCCDRRGRKVLTFPRKTTQHWYMPLLDCCSVKFSIPFQQLCHTTTESQTIFSWIPLYVYCFAIIILFSYSLWMLHTRFQPLTTKMNSTLLWIIQCNSFNHKIICSSHPNWFCQK